MPVQHILVATDFGPASTRALDVAVEIATRFGAKVTVLHAIDESSCVFPCSVPPEIRQSASFRLNEAVGRVRRQVAEVEGILRQGFAWHEITCAATEIGANLVVVGSHGQRDDHHFLIGSVAEKVVRVCAVPVLTVHAWRFEDRTDAGRELAQALLRSDEDVRAVVAVSRGAAIVGAEVAEAFGASLHVLLTRAVVCDGAARGAVCEDGTYCVEPNGARTASAHESSDAVRVQTELLQEATRLRSPRPRADPDGGTILLVSDAILTAAPTIATAQVLRRTGVHRLVAVAPVASMTARAALEPIVDGVVVVQMVEDSIPLGHVYRDLSNPSDGIVIERLAAVAQWATDVGERAVDLADPGVQCET
jgi:predicted phosphoribosyltransferase/nucleotide-binding universal stress UspA family protein